MQGQARRDTTNDYYIANIWVGTGYSGGAQIYSPTSGAGASSVAAAPITEALLEAECGLTDVTILTNTGPASDYGSTTDMSLVFTGRKDGALYRGEVTYSGLASDEPTAVTSWERTGTDAAKVIPVIEAAENWRFQPNTGRWEFNIKLSEDAYQTPAFATSAGLDAFTALDLDITGATILAFEVDGSGSATGNDFRVSVRDITGPITVQVRADTFQGTGSRNFNIASNAVTFDVPATAPNVTLTDFVEVKDTAGNVSGLKFNITVDKNFVWAQSTGFSDNFNVVNGTLTTADSGLNAGKLPELTLAGTFPVGIDLTTSATSRGTVSFNTGTAVRGTDGASAPQSRTITYEFDDVIRPEISVDDVNVENSGLVWVGFSASEAVTLEAADVLITGGATASESGVRGSPGATPFIFLDQPVPENVELTFQVKANSVTDALGNTNELASNVLTWTYDTLGPEITLGAFSFDAGTGLLTSTMTTNEDLRSTPSNSTSFWNVTNGSVTSVESVGGSRSEFIVKVRPAASGEVRLQLKADKVEDNSGFRNKNPAPSNEITYTVIDSIAPVATLDPFTATTSGGQDLFQTTIRVTNGASGPSENTATLTQDDLEITGATIFNMNTGTGNSFTVWVLPAGGPLSLQVKAASFEDLSGNVNAGASNLITETYADTTPPTITLGALNPQSNGTYTSAATISESVANFELGDLTLTNATATMTGSGKDYVVTLRPLAPGEIKLSVAPSTFTDVSGNGNTASNEVSATFVDTVPPEIILGALAAQGGGVFTSAITITEDTADFAATDFTVVNGTVNLSGAGASYIATITSTTSDGTISASVAAATFTDASGNGNLASNTVTVDYDAIPPVVTIDPLAGPAGGMYTTTITLSEAVTSFDLSNLTLTNASATLVPDGLSNRFLLTLTPQTDGEVKLSVAANEVQDASGNQNAASNEVSATYDSTGPTVTIAALVRVGGTYTAGITLSEEVVSFTDGNLTLTNATAVLTGSGTSYSVTLTPLADGLVELSVGAGELQDARGNLSMVSNTVSSNFAAIIPEATLSAPTGPVNGEYTMAISLNVSSTSFEAGDITVTNGSVTALSGAGDTYSATITTGGEGAMTAKVLANTFTDASGNSNVEGNTVTWTHDGTPPAVTIAALAGPSAGVYTADITISEDTTDFVVADLTLTNATATLSGSGRSYTATLTPIADGEVKVSVAADMLTDAAGNGNIASNEVLTLFDTTSPTVTVADFQGPANGQRTAMITTNEETENFVASDLTVTNLTVDSLVDQGDKMTFLATLTPIADGEIKLSVGAGVFTDAAGNGNLASNEVRGSHDGTRPTAEITADVTQTAGGAAFTATITFSEEVTGFAIGDITVVNGAASGLSGEPTVYTATITPTGSGDVEISLAANVASDLAGNGNIASETLVIEDKTVEITQKVISEYIGARTTNLLANQPNTTRMMINRGGGGNAFDAAVTRGVGRFSFQLQPGTNTWLRAKGSWSDIGAETTRYAHAATGHHVFINENLMLGGMLQVDYTHSTTGISTTKGTGWLIGPYLVMKHSTQPLYFELSALAGKSDNTVSPFGTYRDDFETERLLLSGRITGEIELPKVTWYPTLTASHVSDTALSYTDSLDNVIPETKLSITELAAAMDFRKPVSFGAGLTEITGGLSTRWSMTQGFSTGQAAIVEDPRLRLDLGISHQSEQNIHSSLSGYYDGMFADDFSAFGLEFRLDWTF